jgi:hypothetical protein
MPRVSTLDKKAIATYCGVPRNISDICSRFSIGTQQAHRVMQRLILQEIVSARFIKHEGARCKFFILSSIETEDAWREGNVSIESLPAHDPFGLTTKLAEQLRASGFILDTRNIRRIRMEDKDEPDRKRNSNPRRRRILEGFRVAKT